MDEIEYIEQSAYFVNQSGNPMDLDVVIDRLYSLTHDYGYSTESTVFSYYLDRIAEDMVISEGNSIGPTPMRMLPYKLEGDPENSTNFSDENYRFYIFYVLAWLHQELADYKGMRELVGRYGNDFQD